MTITLLAYKAESDDYAMGCHMASYSSDFKWKSSMDRKVIAEFMAEILFSNKHLDHSETGYEMTFLFNGAEAESNDLSRLQTEILLEATRLAEAKDVDHKAALTAAKEQSEAKEKSDKEQRERKTLADLQEKYPAAAGK